MGISLRAAAKQLGISHPALLKAAKTGRVTVDKDGTYDVEKCRASLAAKTNMRKQRKRPVKAVTKISDVAVTEQAKVVTDAEPLATNGDYQEAQRQREWLLVQKEALELARRRGELGPIGEINAWVAGMIIRAREVLIRIGPELRDRLAQETVPHKCERLVMAEIQRALNELAEFRPNAQ